MSKISELSDGGALQSTDYLIAVRSGGNVKVQADGNLTLGTVTADGLTVAKGSNGTYATLSGDDAGGGRGLSFTSSSVSGSVGAKHTLNALSALGEIALQTASKNRLNIGSGGDISFYEDTGTTAKLAWSASNERLTLSGSDYQFGIAQGANQPWYLRGVSDGGFRLHLNGTGDILTATSAGNVGINSPATNAKLEVVATSGEVFRADASGGAYRIVANQTGVNMNGNVGIGTSSPASKLDVVGTTTLIGLSSDLVLQGTTGSASDCNEVRWRTTTSGGYDLAKIYVKTGANFYDANLVFETQQAGFAGTLYERMRIDNAGNVGIGRTPVAYGSFNVLDLAGSAGAIQKLIHTGSTVELQSYASSTVGTIGTATSHPLLFTTGDTERARIDSSGNVGIGTTSPSQKLDINGTVRISDGTFGGYFGAGNAITISGASTDFCLRSDDVLSFASGGPYERMRIDSSGNLLVGTTTAVGKFSIEAIPTGTARSVDYSNTGGTVDYYLVNNVNVGSIAVTTTATTYNTSSDYRLKDVDGPITNSGAYIDALKPVQGSWKADGSRFIGLIAHEVQEVSETQIATGEKDGEEMQGMDYSAPELIANLIAEIQSLRARVAQLEGA